MVAVKQHSGPLPTPADTEQYERILPGFTERSMRIAENEQQLFHGHIRRAQCFSFVEAFTNKIVGGIVVLGVVGFGIYFVFRGNEMAGTFAMVVGVLVPLVSAYLGRSGRKK